MNTAGRKAELDIDRGLVAVHGNTCHPADIGHGMACSRHPNGSNTMFQVRFCRQCHTSRSCIRLNLSRDADAGVRERYCNQIGRKVARAERIPGLQKKPGSQLAMQVIWHNAALVRTEGTADAALGRLKTRQFAQSISNLMASINKAQVESRAWERIASTVCWRSSVSNAEILAKSAINIWADYR